MALTEPCYTLLNVQDSEPFNEMAIKQSLGECKLLHEHVSKMKEICVFQKRAKSL